MRGVLAGVVLVAFALSGSAAPRTIAGVGLRMELSGGWDGRVYARPGPGPSTVLQAANFDLPAADDDAGSKALRRMRGGSVRILLFEVGNPPGPRFPPTRLPLRFGRSDFGAPRGGIPTSHAFARRTFWTAGRSFVLWADFAGNPVRQPLLRAVNRVLSTLAIQPTRPLVGEAGWRRLHRPLRPPRLSAGGACPRTRTGRSTPATAFGLGREPVYAVLGGGRGIVSPEGDLVRDGQTFHKTQLPLPSRPLLVRGARIGRPAVVRFSVGVAVRSELRYPSAAFGTHDWRYIPSSTVLPGPGCYGLQVDGTSFSQSIVFAAARG